MEFDEDLQGSPEVNIDLKKKGDTLQQGVSTTPNPFLADNNGNVNTAELDKYAKIDPKTMQDNPNASPPSKQFNIKVPSNLIETTGKKKAKITKT